MQAAATRHALVGAAVLVIIGTAIGAWLSRPPAGADITEGGSPLYGIAVEESIKGLRRGKDDEDPAPGAPCPKCGEVHALPHGVPAAGVAAHSAGGGSRDYAYCARCRVYHRRQAQPDRGAHAVSPDPERR